MPELTTAYEAAKARVEAGDLSFEAMAAMCNAHAAILVRDLEASERLDRGVKLTAEFTNGSARVSPKLTLCRIALGRRTILEILSVSGKREARAIAAERGFTCWNF